MVIVIESATPYVAASRPDERKVTTSPRQHTISRVFTCGT